VLPRRGNQPATAPRHPRTALTAKLNCDRTTDAASVRIVEKEHSGPQGEKYERNEPTSAAVASGAQDQLGDLPRMRDQR
jgi:hypothetical protein